MRDIIWNEEIIQTKEFCKKRQLSEFSLPNNYSLVIKCADQYCSFAVISYKQRSISHQSRNASLYLQSLNNSTLSRIAHNLPMRSLRMLELTGWHKGYLCYTVVNKWLVCLQNFFLLGLVGYDYRRGRNIGETEDQLSTSCITYFIKIKY